MTGREARAAVVRSWRQLRPWRVHSQVVSVAGACWIVIGVLWATSALTPDIRRSLAFPIELLDFVPGLNPGYAIGAGWVLSGLAAVLSARWPAWDETWGYQALAAWAVIWGMFYFTSWAFWGAPARGLRQTIIFGLFAFFVWSISRLVNPDELVVAIAITEEPPA